MTKGRGTRAYLRMLRNGPFAALWAGSTISSFGDALTWVSLIWIVYSLTGSARDVSVLVVVYTAPVIVGGLVVGPVLDRFDRRRVLMAVNSFLGVAVASVPLLSHLGHLRIWHLQVVAGFYGLLKMANLAGVPSLLPSLVPEEDLNTANAMESISFWVSDVGGPVLAGLLIGIIGGANVLIFDAASYLLFIGFLARVRVPPASPAQTAPTGRDARGDRGLRPAARFAWRSPAILAITLMFMAFNVGEGMLFVLLPVYARTVLGGSAATYGWLLSTFSLALLGSTLVGAVSWRWTLGRSIAMAQALAGLTFLGFLVRPGLGVSLMVLAVAGTLTAPLTIWAQTVRMRLIPAEAGTGVRAASDGDAVDAPARGRCRRVAVGRRDGDRAGCRGAGGVDVRAGTDRTRSSRLGRRADPGARGLGRGGSQDEIPVGAGEGSPSRRCGGDRRGVPGVHPALLRRARCSYAVTFAEAKVTTYEHR